ncbi:alternative ribosome rescue aminoacyl-tRNA hydrolase ArfB [Flavilitoribacter nigricans]|uniref:Aminoacyl-tRNA hydrolase n=1 Tax=Flavilitoribacter nigricans (strain ATCC 23147 / DSM 23189 / NBRC 102662 / NCIMB 1420 / SS-2) TaxID=1122177 RepID=A0A2D0N4T1_FLAN2|nr:alternative ribosome rescue aminoacyl-tRNA hydrolase ArfB [Flavilitoribacter nigricans]PHN02793.1 aminoacyl-tRNA hydrolase [Flavilitoribacter nigricans DSM 23189 = NBRC 102662]
MDINILKAELDFRTSRSSGSGGQHVNKVATRVELLFDVDASQFLNDSQKARIKRKLYNRITKEGVLLLDCSETRSQHRNKQLVIEQFEHLIREALRPPKRRKKVPNARQANPRKRLENKRRHSQKKALRGKVEW